jgi:hypothetical protein
MTVGATNSQIHKFTFRVKSDRALIRNDVSKHSENCESHVLEGLENIVPVKECSSVEDFALFSNFCVSVEKLPY